MSVIGLMAMIGGTGVSKASMVIRRFYEKLGISSFILVFILTRKV